MNTVIPPKWISKDCRGFIAGVVKLHTTTKQAVKKNIKWEKYWGDNALWQP